LINALCDRLTSVYAVTGIPVTVYSARYAPFFVMEFRRLRRPVPADASTTVSMTGIFLYQNP
jgi:hypothetical protein